jgi:hypothetical protein
VVKQLLKKEAICCITVLLLLIPTCAYLAVGTTSTMLESRSSSSLMVTAGSRNLTIHISGTMGKNGWYVSSVLITITNDDGINHTFYKLHTNDSWTEYTAPIMVSTDGIYEAYAYCIDPQGEEQYAGPVPFKVDKTPPWVQLNQTMRFWRWRFTVDVSDNMSGPGPVAIYIDNLLVGNFTMPPYAFIWKGPVWLIIWKYHRTGDKSILPSVTAYDLAGNSAEKQATTLRLP